MALEPTGMLITREEREIIGEVSKFTEISTCGNCEIPIKPEKSYVLT
jgi:hypothetical protein